MQIPIGRHLHTVTRAVQRAFNEALEEAGGNLAMWWVLASVEWEDFATQQDLARTIGIEGPTLTHHLDSMERRGLVARRRDPDNRRAVRVELTTEGRRLFERLREAAMEFDQRLTSGLSDAELGDLRRQLTRLAENVSR